MCKICGVDSSDEFDLNGSIDWKSEMYILKLILFINFLSSQNKIFSVEAWHRMSYASQMEYACHI
jgi:hypothetical protein